MIVEWLFARGHAADLILVVMAGEAAWLMTRGGWRASDAFVRIAPGALIVLSLRAALTGAAWPWVAAPLILSLPPHVADLRRTSGGRRS